MWTHQLLHGYTVWSNRLLMADNRVALQVLLPSPEYAQCAQVDAHCTQR